MEVHPGVFVSSTSTDAWRVDPEVGGGAEEHVLFDDAFDDALIELKERSGTRSF